MITLEKMKLKTTPLSKIVRVDARLRTATIHTTPVVMIAPNNAHTAEERIPAMVRGSEKKSESAAPTAAPPETPRVKGLASGLRKRAWKATPLTANAPPAINARITRGRRSLKYTALLTSSAAASSPTVGESHCAPHEGASSKTSRVPIKRILQ